MPLYLVDGGMLEAKGPFATKDALREEFEDTNNEELLVAEVDEDGVMKLTEVSEYLELEEVED